jgi:CrcB protein
MLRYFVQGWIGSQWGETFPWGTLLVNVSGSAVIGLIAAVTAPEGRWFASPGTRLFLMTGICGGYTTFSSFSLNTLNLLRDGEWFYASSYIVLSVILCLAGVWAGYQIGDKI